MRVLHLIRTWSEHRPSLGGRQSPSDAAVLACRSDIAGQTDSEHKVCVLGASADEARVAALGLRTTDRVPVPLGVLRLASASLRRFIATRPLFDEIRCWDHSLMDIVRTCAPMSRVIDASTTIGDCHPVAPRDAASVRQARRAALGIADDELLACLLADPPSRGDAVRMMFMVGTLYEAGLRPHVILPRGSDRLTRASRFHKAARLPGRLFVTAEPAWSWLPACDVAVMVREADRVSAAERLMIRCAHSIGVPVVAPRDDSVIALYPGDAAACLSPSNHAASLARSLVRVIDSAALRTSIRRPIGDAAWGREPSPALLSEAGA